MVKKMADIAKPIENEDTELDINDAALSSSQGGGGGGAFSTNPLMGALIRPIWKSKDPPTSDKSLDSEDHVKSSTWRRVQDDDDDDDGDG